MRIPEEIAARLKVMPQKITGRGELGYSDRVELLRSFDDVENPGGHVLRARLALTCASKCTHLWDAKVTAINLEQVLHFAEKCMEEQTLYSELRGVGENLRTETDDVLASGIEHHRAAYAGFATVAAISAIIRDEVLDESVESEKELSPERWSSAFWTSLALAGAAVWEQVQADDRERRKYWLWYIEEAVPSLW